MKTKPNNALGQFEQLVITAIIALGDNAYGLAIQAKLSEYYRDKEVNLGSVYVTLERLEDKGYVSSKFSDPIPERGGRSRRLFRLLPTGQRALQESVSIQVRSQKSIAAFWRKLKWSPKGVKVHLKYWKRSSGPSFRIHCGRTCS